MLRKLLVPGLLLLFLPLAGQEVEDLGLSLEQLEDRLFYLVNRERSERGLAELQFDPRLRAMARDHSLKMIQEKKLAHDFPGYENLAERAVRSGLYFSELGENVASGDTFVMRFYHEQLMASPGHRENLLSGAFRQLGIGLGLSGNQYYVTQEFAALFAPVPAADMEREMEDGLKTRLGRQIQRPHSSAEMKEYCRRLAAQFLEGQSPQRIADSLGVATVHNRNFVDKDDGFGMLVAAINESRPLYWALGAAFGRTEKNPGGIYALTLIEFPDLRDKLKRYGGLDAVILESVQKIHGMARGMARAPKLDGAAAEISMQFYSATASPDSIHLKDYCKLILAYQTLSLDALPDDIALKIAAVAPRISSVGIHVFYPLLEGLPGNYFIVAILAN
jgi:hypothetical protein